MAILTLPEAQWLHWHALLTEARMPWQIILPAHRLTPPLKSLYRRTIYLDSSKPTCIDAAQVAQQKERHGASKEEDPAEPTSY